MYLFLFWIYLKIATILKWPPPSFSTWSQARSWSPEGERGPRVKVDRGKGAHQSGRNRGSTRRTAPCKYFCFHLFFIYNSEICLLQTSVKHVLNIFPLVELVPWQYFLGWYTFKYHPNIYQNKEPTHINIVGCEENGASASVTKSGFKCPITNFSNLFI